MNTHCRSGIGTLCSVCGSPADVSKWIGEADHHRYMSVMVACTSPFCLHIHLRRIPLKGGKLCAAPSRRFAANKDNPLWWVAVVLCMAACYLLAVWGLP